MTQRAGEEVSRFAQTAGLAALVLAVVLVFLPLGGYVTPVVALLSLFSRRSGSVLGLAAVLVSFINVWLLSPLPSMAAKSAYYWGEWRPVLIWAGLMFCQVVAGVVLYVGNNKKKRV